MADPKPKAPITTGTIAKSVYELSSSPLWKVADQALAKEDWPEALDALNELAAEAQSVKSRLGGIASRVVGRHWSPLLDEMEAD